MGLFYDQALFQLSLFQGEGDYEIVWNDSTQMLLSDIHSLFLTGSKGNLIINDTRETLGKAKVLKIIPKDPESSFLLKAGSAPNELRSFQGSLIVEANRGLLIPVNEVPLEAYLAGVVETEGGPNSTEEYYKTQAIVCRTFM